MSDSECMTWVTYTEDKNKSEFKIKPKEKENIIELRSISYF